MILTVGCIVSFVGYLPITAGCGANLSRVIMPIA